MSIDYKLNNYSPLEVDIHFRGDEGDSISATGFPKGDTHGQFVVLRFEHNERPHFNPRVLAFLKLDEAREIIEKLELAIEEAKGDEQ